jgi:hypothetical protein
VARPAFFVHHGGSGALLADDVMRAELFDLSVTGFRYRIQQEGAGSVSYSPVFPLAITLAMCNWLCYADCDGSGSLDLFDFLCFQNAFAAEEYYADCDGSAVLDFFDFLCFQNEFFGECR